MVEVVKVDNSVWEKKKPLDKEVQDLLSKMTNWSVNETHAATFESPQKSLKSILIREFKSRNLVRVKKINNDPKKWHIMLEKRTRKRSKNMAKKTPATSAS